MDWLITEDAKLNDPNGLLEETFLELGPDCAKFHWLQERKAILQRRDDIFERLCLECEPTDELFIWLEKCSQARVEFDDVANFQTISKSRSRKLYWLLCDGAKFCPNTLLLRLLDQRYGEYDWRVPGFKPKSAPSKNWFIYSKPHARRRVSYLRISDTQLSK